MLISNPLRVRFLPRSSVIYKNFSYFMFAIRWFSLKGAPFAVALFLLTSLRVFASEPEDRPKSNGTGFVVSRQGHILTNDHVVENCPSIRVIIDGQQKEVPVVARDKENDLAIVKLSGTVSNVARFRKGRNIRSGDNVVVVGFPYHSLLASEANVTTGTVSALAGLRNDTRFLQIAAPVQPGNSGGPVLDKSGHVIGIVESKLNALAMAIITGDIPQNVNFAIKDAIAKSFLESHGVIYEMAASEKQLEAAEIGEIAKQFTHLIECYPETTDAKKHRIEAERRALTEVKRQQEIAREQARIQEQEERLQFAKQKEDEQRASEQAEHQRKREIVEKEATEMKAASQRVSRFHDEERAQETQEEARLRGQEARAQAQSEGKEPVRLAKVEVNRLALNAGPQLLEEARRRGQEARARSLSSEELTRELEEELKKVRQIQPVTTLQTPPKSSGPNSFWTSVQEIIKSNWQPPPIAQMGQSYSTTLTFRFFWDGRVEDVKAQKSSGNKYFDMAAQTAVLKPRHFPPFPAEITETYQDVEMLFTVGRRGE
jgi:TolA protein